MKQITCFICSLSSGGAEHQLTMLADMLVERGYDITIVTYSYLQDHYNCNELVKRVRLDSNNKIRTFFNIFKYFLISNTDCVISFGSRSSFLSLIPLLFRPSIKIISSERCTLFSKIPFASIINYKLLYRRTNYIVPNSFTQSEDLKLRCPYAKDKIITITNYTDPKLYHCNPKIESDILQIGIFCRYSKQKNYSRFVEAIKKIAQQSHKPFHVDWFGNKHDGNAFNPCFLEFSALINSYNLGNYITLHDHVHNVAERIHDYDVLALPSIGEGFSNSISEYICSGKPVLCGDVSDNKFMVHDGENGFVFDPFNIDSMVNAFLKFFALSPEDRTEMGLQSRIIAESLFDKEKFVQSYINLIEN